MSEIPTLDNPVMRKLFKILHETYLGAPITLLGVKVMEYLGNGFSPRGYHGKRFNFSAFGKVILVGQSHLDAAWRWRTKQGILKAKATFSKAIDHIENLPEFTFMQPSPQYYAWMKERYPELYARMKKAVQEGRFIISGGNWVECDNNIPNGESLVRQRLYGQRFYLSEFGKMSDVEFMQDCFGFNQNLPQIYAKSGAKMFATGKLFWNETSTIPFGMCHWKAPDGSLLPMIHMHFGYYLPYNYGKKYPLVYLLGKPGRKLTANYQTTAKEFADWRSRDYMMNTFFGYGLGDGGHGPIEAELLVTRLMRRLWPKRYKFLQEGDMVALMKPFFDRWATWEDEWYLDQHRGTYTSVSYVKRGNREAEIKMDHLERLAVILHLNGYSFSQPDLEKNWKYLLYNQFHDILPGSSIPEVYEDYRKDRNLFDQYYAGTMEQLVQAIVERMKVQEKFGTPIPIFNSLSWDREDLLEIEIGKYHKGVVRDSKGNPVFTQIIKNSWKTLEPDAEEYIALCAPGSYSPLSINLLYFDSEGSKIENGDSSKSPESVNITENDQEITLENKFVQVFIEKATGLIRQIHSKECSRDILNTPGNQLLLFREQKHTDAWNIDPDYAKDLVEYRLSEMELKITEDGPLRCAVTIRRKILSSTFIQTVGLTATSPTIILGLDAEMKDPKILVKLNFDTIINTDHITAEIPYAYINRSIKPQTLIDKPRWEQACQKWISVYDENEDIGFTILNNGKYGYNAIPSEHGGTIVRPTVVRTPKFTGYARETRFVKRSPEGGLNPDMPPFTDMEFHRDIQYGLRIHTGDWKKEVWKSAYELNYPMRTSKSWLSMELSGKVSPENSSSLDIYTENFKFCRCQNDNVRIGALKFAEDAPKSPEESSFILRLVEQSGKTGPCTLQLNSSLSIQGVEEVDLLELNPNKSRILVSNANEITIEMKPYEILTLKFTCHSK